ncbi:flagellin N-terminal helical domain-containing protein [Pseudoduganella namucuonensis]|uniref:Flagellin n=1 Tax=Pseudoduganella namucuonensis TaxID=1035707 RepID=A0A1I7L5A2_9BURK|nr:flagellin [Pseudoduganella namucuonensis]SFV04907.1 flagellin [Pseudoduganella namucuonensis]
MLSLHTNSASLAANNAADRSQKLLGTSNTRLATGYRINSAQDDAAGLQIATRLHAQNSGMRVAMRNTQNSISKLQSIDAMMEGLGKSLLRMAELATMAADDGYSDTDRAAMQAEYDELGRENSRVVSEDLLNGDSGFFPGEDDSPDFNTRFQFGASADESTEYNFEQTWQSAYDAAQNNAGTGVELLNGNANASIGKLQEAVGKVGTSRSELGGLINRLQHSFDNLMTMHENTSTAEGRIMDTDFASETAQATVQLMLLQSSTNMIRRSNSSSALVISLLN